MWHLEAEDPSAPGERLRLSPHIARQPTDRVSKTYTGCCRHAARVVLRGGNHAIHIARYRSTLEGCLNRWMFCVNSSVVVRRRRSSPCGISISLNARYEGD